MHRVYSVCSLQAGELHGVAEAGTALAVVKLLAFALQGAGRRWETSRTEPVRCSNRPGRTCCR